MLDNGPVARSRTKSIGASVHAAACHKQAEVNCLAVGCDWPDEDHADVHKLLTWQRDHLDTV